MYASFTTSTSETDFSTDFSLHSVSRDPSTSEYKDEMTKRYGELMEKIESEQDSHSSKMLLKAKGLMKKGDGSGLDTSGEGNIRRAKKSVKSLADGIVSLVCIITWMIVYVLKHI